MEIKRSGSQLFAKAPAEWFGTVRVTYLTVNALRAVASLELIRDGGARRLADGVMSEATNPVATVRAATRADVPAIGRLGALLVRMHHDFDPERFIAPPPRTEDAYASFIGRQIGESSVVLLVAERDGEVLGYAYAGVEGPDYMSLRGPAGVLYDIVVDPNHRGHGVGRLLLEAILAALKARGATRVVVSTAEQNEAAQRLCRYAGAHTWNRQIGTGKLEVSARGLGCMGMRANSGPPEIRQEMIALSQAAVDRGVTFSIRRRPGTSPNCVKILNSRSNPIRILRYRYSTASARARLVVT